MKKIVIIVSILITFQVKATHPPIDTLLLLKTRIENNKSNFVNKPFKVLLDTLQKLGLPIIEYSGAHDNKEGLYIRDTIWVDGFTLYLEKLMYSDKERHHDSIFFKNKGVDTTNTHIKTIKVQFQNPIPYLTTWEYLADLNNINHNGIGGVKWNTKIAKFYRNCIIKDIKVDEY